MATEMMSFSGRKAGRALSGESASIEGYGDLDEAEDTIFDAS